MVGHSSSNYELTGSAIHGLPTGMLDMTIRSSLQPPCFGCILCVPPVRLSFSPGKTIWMEGIYISLSV